MAESAQGSAYSGEGEPPAPSTAPAPSERRGVPPKPKYPPGHPGSAPAGSAAAESAPAETAAPPPSAPAVAAESAATGHFQGRARGRQVRGLRRAAAASSTPAPSTPAAAEAANDHMQVASPEGAERSMLAAIAEASPEQVQEEEEAMASLRRFALRRSPASAPLAAPKSVPEMARRWRARVRVAQSNAASAKWASAPAKAEPLAPATARAPSGPPPSKPASSRPASSKPPPPASSRPASSKPLPVKAMPKAKPKGAAAALPIGAPIGKRRPGVGGPAFRVATPPRQPSAPPLAASAPVGTVLATFFPKHAPASLAGAPSSTAASSTVIPEEMRGRRPLPRGSIGDMPELEPEPDRAEEDSAEGDDRSGWSWKLVWLGVIAPGDPSGSLMPDHALPKLHGIMAMGTHRLDRRGARRNDCFPEGIIGKGAGDCTLLWGNPNLVERFEDCREDVVRVSRPSAPAGVDLQILQATVVFHPGNVYPGGSDLGNTLQVAVMIAVPQDAYDMHDDEPWERMYAAKDWCAEACKEAVLLLAPTTRLVFASVGHGQNQLGPRLKQAMSAHCCMVADGPRNANDINTTGSGVWMIGAHTWLQGPHEKRRGAEPHEQPASAQSFAPAVMRQQHGRPLRVGMFNLFREGPDQSSVPVVYLGQGRRQRRRTNERQKQRRHRPFPARGGGARAGPKRGRGGGGDREGRGDLQGARLSKRRRR